MGITGDSSSEAIYIYFIHCLLFRWDTSKHIAKSMAQGYAEMAEAEISASLNAETKT